MLALIKEGSQLQLQELPIPEPQTGEVLIRVRAAGLCRTDVLVMQGKLPAINPLIPGHEFAGEITAIGSDITQFQLGQPVTVHPLIGCGLCPCCQIKRPEHCPDVQMLGVERHGAFAEYICVPAQAVWQVPDSLSWQEAAYTEPVAATLGVLRAGIQPEQKGWITGSNRIAALTSRVLNLHGCQPGIGSLAEFEPDSLDYVIETGLKAEELPTILQVLKPGGTLIAKSRHLGELPLPWNMLVRKDIRLQGLYYGSFKQALAMINTELLGDLMGKSYRLSDWQSFIAPAPEAQKPFLVMD